MWRSRWEPMLPNGCAFLIGKPSMVSKKLVGVLSGITLTALAIFLVSAGILSWLRTPKVRIADVEKVIAVSLPEGTPRKDVEDWLVRRSMVMNSSYDGRGRQCIESWISDTGPSSEWPFGIRDIRVRFYFDKNGHLVSFSLNEEDRF